MLTMKGKYGLKAMVHLAGLPEGGMALSADIAEANAISKKFLDAILADLRHAGFVFARKGRGGGYRLTRRPEEIRVGHILRVLDGPLAPIHCASRTAYQRCEDCPDETACAVRLTMLEVRDAITEVLDRKTLAEMRDCAAREARTAEILAAGE
ncbi:MAG: Rrf2 family transcriptional regulator [Alphaproteobacteria bacterium HGW-Alphaproteobacteria-10]|nr:MAG: Rrf2 family transcriptional regulator [Alphaproteobacteria bacterium HGW-Alphaproteobacteria-10]